jgi:hypothetical protein
MSLLISDYFMPMAERVYGDAAATERERGAATLARWIFRERPTELQCDVYNVRSSCLAGARQSRSAMPPKCSWKPHCTMSPHARGLRSPYKERSYGRAFARPVRLRPVDRRINTMSKSKPYRASDFLARRADAAQKAAKDAVRAERLARARADIERTLAAARANAA